MIQQINNRTHRNEAVVGEQTSVHTLAWVVLYIMENDADRSALMQVVLLSFTSRVTAAIQPGYDRQ